jgi:mono/diheme cytochrome c family protein
MFLVLLILGLPIATYGWYKFLRDVPQPDWITGDPETNFLYGSIGGESQGGIPYWIIAVLPRIFDDLMPGPGGYAAFGLPWEEGAELPAGFSRKTIGFDRVGFNCALCHATQYRTAPNVSPVIVAAGGNHTADIQRLLEFFTQAANDPRFNAETILTHIDMSYPLSWIDRQLYRFMYIPMTRKRLREQGRDFAWMADFPRWGPGRDAAVNIAKYNFLKMQIDGSVDTTDFPALWNLQTRVQEGRVWPADDHSLTADWSTLDVDPSRLMLFNLDGATTSLNAVVIDSAVSLQAQNNRFFRRRVQELEDWLMTLPAPRYPLPLDPERVAVGEVLFEQHCAICHAGARDNRLGTVIPLAEIGTDPERADAWSREAADLVNQTVYSMFKLTRTPMGKPSEAGYVALQLDGVWLRAPYLHNGSVPTLRAMLEPVDRRPRSFYRGYDVIDRWNGGFISRRCAGDEAELPAEPESVQWGCMSNHEGWYYDTGERGNSNRGHVFGTTLDDASKDALVEYLKSL